MMNTDKPTAPATKGKPTTEPATLRKRLPKGAQESLCVDGLVRPWPEAANFLGCGRRKIFDMLKKGELPYTRVGADRKIPLRALIEYGERRLIQRTT